VCFWRSEAVENPGRIKLPQNLFAEGNMCTKSLGLTMLLMGTAGLAMAGAVSAPEIGGPATGVGAVTLLTGALLVIRGRRKK